MTRKTSFIKRQTGSCGQRQSGTLLLQVAFAVPVLILGALGFLYAFQSNFKATRDIWAEDLEGVMFANCKEMLVDADFSTLYATYNGNSIAPISTTLSPTSYVTDFEVLEDGSGNQCQVLVDFFVNETTLPAEFAGLPDIDGDPLTDETDRSTTYKLLPTRLTLSYNGPTGNVTERMFFIIGNKS